MNIPNYQTSDKNILSHQWRGWHRSLHFSSLVAGYTRTAQHQTQEANEFIHLDNATLNAVFDNQLDSFDRAMLSQSMDSIHGLCSCFRTIWSFQRYSHTYDIQPSGGERECKSVSYLALDEKYSNTAGFHQLKTVALDMQPGTNKRIRTYPWDKRVMPL